MIGIVDYGMGNLRSVEKGLQRVGGRARVLEPGQPLPHDLDKLVLPGVGAFADGMDQLRRLEWVQPVLAWIESGRPMLGICLGMQLLFESSREDAPSPDQPVEGLGVLPGRVVRFDEAAEEDAGGERLKVPHMGWNELTWRRTDPLLAGLEQGSHVYFVHSYYACPEEPEGGEPIASAYSDYGGPFCASVHRGRLWATQFHPEKSQRVGLTILHNFVNLDP